MHPAIFLDRDGVIIKHRPDYVRAWEDVVIFPQALGALARIKNSIYKIVIVTNQSAIGRGIISRNVAEQINYRLTLEINEAGGRIDQVFICPHKPEENCSCRKPRPGLLFEAARLLSIELPNSILIGDSLTDLEAGRAAGVKQVALVRTGRGVEQENNPLALHLRPFPVFDTLSQALDNLLTKQPISSNSILGQEDMPCHNHPNQS